MIPHCAFHLYFSIHHCGFDLYFSNSWWWLVSFPVFTDHLFVVFGEKNLDPFLIFKKLGCLCIYWIVRILHILHTDFLSGIWSTNFFSPILLVVFSLSWWCLWSINFQILMKFSLSICVIIVACALGVTSKKTLPHLWSQNLHLCFLPSYMV